ncbi:MAG: sigma-70 family RNA polymerase sigma factor [Candidatus Hydrogenedentes bacterium]|nr:sigma-70 family RNA polymerase sigma factor [Candidatus Hydrogenedentota bacterium]
MERTDAALLERWQRHRDADAFAELVHRYLGMVVASCRRVVGDAALAEDVAQECFVALMQSRESIRVSLGAWLHTVAVRRSINHVRSDSRRRKRETVFAEAAHTETAIDTCLEEILSAVDEAIIDLPDHLRAVVIGRFLESRTHVDLARHLNLSESNARYRVDKGVEQIRASLRKRGIVASVGVLTAALSQTVEAAPSGLAGALCKLAASGAVGAPIVASAGYVLLAKAVVGLLVVAALGAGYWAVTNKSSVAPNSPNVAIVPVQSNSALDEPRGKGNTPKNTASQTAATASTVIPLANNQADPEPFSIEGRVYDADTGEGIEGVGVEVFPSGGGPVVYRDKRKTDVNGVYRTKLIPDGTYHVQIDDIAEYPDARKEPDTNVTLKDSKPALGIDFALKKGVPVAGIVFDKNGNPASGVKVVAERSKAHGIDVARAVSMEQGQFQLHVSRDLNQIDIQAEEDTMESAVVEGLTLDARGVDDVVLNLDQPKTASLSGRVIDGNGRPVKGAHLYLVRKDGSVPNLDGTTADGQGQFRFSDLPATEFAVIVTPETANGFSTAEEYLRITLAPGEKRSGIEIVYGEKGGLAIEGRVVDVDGKPVQGAEITCYARNLEKAYTDVNGIFRVTGLEDREYMVAAENPADPSRTETRIRAGTLDAEIVLKRCGQLTGRVLADDTGEPLTNFTVSLLRGKSDITSDMLFGSGRSHESIDGSFSYDKRSAEITTVAVWAPGYAPAWKHIEIQAGARTNIEFRLTPRPPVSGIVVNEAGEGIAGAYVYFVIDVSTDSLERAAAARTDSEGKFTVDSLPLDVTRLYAYQEGYGVGKTALSGENRIVLPAQATIDGVVHQDGTMENLVVDVCCPENRSLPYVRQSISPAGTFLLTGLSAGALKISVHPNLGDHHIRKTLELKSGQALSMEFTFTRGNATLEGHVLDEGSPVTNRSLELLHDSGDYIDCLRGATDNSASFRFERVWTGTSTLRVLKVGQEIEWYEIPIVLQEGEALVQDIDLSESGS